MKTPYQKLLQAIDDVIRLEEIHTEIAGDDRGRKFKVDVLNSSGVVLITACWEAFVEECLRSAFDFVLKNATEPDDLPKLLRKSVAKVLREEKDELVLMRKLFGDNWKVEAKKRGEEVIKSTVGTLNTPKPEKIIPLFDELLGIKDITSSWKWQKQSRENAKKRLTDYIKLRGDIAHGAKINESVQKATVKKYREFVLKIAIKTSNSVRAHLLGAFPNSKEIWKEIEFA